MQWFAWALHAAMHSLRVRPLPLSLNAGARSTNLLHRWPVSSSAYSSSHTVVGCVVGGAGSRRRHVGDPVNPGDGEEDGACRRPHVGGPVSPSDGAEDGAAVGDEVPGDPVGGVLGGGLTGVPVGTMVGQAVDGAVDGCGVRAYGVGSEVAGSDVVGCGVVGSEVVGSDVVGANVGSVGLPVGPDVKGDIDGG